ncbi:hypothetical protein AYI69_g6278 [Smittium culicis]|uniref:Integrase catalytic domain-containing protein n=1 Tax=Smittium culicis TaxID=133412 RepID=A0A1R1Y003_9FUNG|nr:hypothetical protein AYI69_g6278 [Smittium culicis]
MYTVSKVSNGKACVRFPYVKATSDETAVTAKRVGESMISIFGAAKEITADRGSCYTSSVYKIFCNKYSVNLNLLPAFQPEWSGLV